MRKRLTTVVMEAPRVALLDNVPDGSTLESASLAALLTADSVDGPGARGQPEGHAARTGSCGS